MVTQVDAGALMDDVPSSSLELKTQTGKTMAKKSTNQLAAEAGTKQSGMAYPAEPHELNAQRQRLKKAAALGAEALKSSAPAATPDIQSGPPRSLVTSDFGPSDFGFKRTPLQSEQPKSPETAAVVAHAPKPTAAKAVNVAFILFEPDARQVALGGDFNRWASDATPMKRHDGGQWEIAVALAPGRYEYKFMVDGHWMPDPLAHENVWNQHGTLNSVIEVRA